MSTYFEFYKPRYSKEIKEKHKTFKVWYNDMLNSDNFSGFDESELILKKKQLEMEEIAIIPFEINEILLNTNKPILKFPNYGKGFVLNKKNLDLILAEIPKISFDDVNTENVIFGNEDGGFHNGFTSFGTFIESCKKLEIGDFQMALNAIKRKIIQAKYMGCEIKVIGE